ncbi:MAG TPA: S41 family peptidase [Acidobacteriota bacterium]|nr:S41 family peptidase [Acidobacteriota bacterium]
MNRPQPSTPAGLLPLLLLLLITPLVACASNGRSQWEQAALRDLQAVRQTVQRHHPGPVDERNPHFEGWLAQGYDKAVEMASQVNSEAGYRFLLQYYASGFNDGHLKVRFDAQSEDWQWPGFSVSFNGGRFLVNDIIQDESQETLPGTGAVLLSCDGRPIREIMLEEIIPFYFGVQDLESSWARLAPRLLIWDGNPWRTRFMSCRFRFPGLESETQVPLEWRDPPPELSLEQLLSRATFGARTAYGIQALSSDMTWVSLPSFGPRTPEEFDALNEIIERLPEYRDSKLLVFDVRGNGGGNSQWGSNLVRQFWGRDFASHVQSQSAGNPVYAEWRVSRENIDYLKGLLPALEKRFGSEAEVTEMVRQTSQGMDQALEQGRDLFHLGPDASSPSPAAPEPANPVKAQVVLLTDGRCASACLDFADEVLLMPGVMHAGFPTSADTLYMDVRSVRLPSDNGRLVIPLKVYRNRRRGNNQPYVPQLRFEGDLSDTQALQEWLRDKLEISRD